MEKGKIYRLKHGEYLYCEFCGFPHYCGDEIYQIGSEYDNSDRYFCNKICYYLYLNKYPE